MSVGIEHWLRHLWQAWIIRGGRPEAEPLSNQEGWVLRLCGRARISAWLIFVLFAGMLMLTMVMQIVSPWPAGEFWPLALVFTGSSLFATYYLVFAYRYRVVLTDDGLTLKRFLLKARRLSWLEIVSFTFSPGGDLLSFQTDTGQRLGIYASLNGLSAIRRCLAAFTSLARTEDSWRTIDPLLMEHAPAWRCDDMDLEDDPFSPLGSWKSADFPDKLYEREDVDG